MSTAVDPVGLSVVTDPEPYSPDWWRDFLGARLDLQAELVNLCSAYYDGQHRLTYGTPLWRDAFRLMMGEFSDNWMALVVDSSVERLRVQGFRFGETEDADEDAWKIWQANDLDLYSRIAHTEAIKCGQAYLLVAPPGLGEDVARITVEHPSQCTVVKDPADPRLRVAGLKRWSDIAGYVYATVFLKDSIYRWYKGPPIGWVRGMKPEWVPRGDGYLQRNPLGQVPLIALENNPQLLHGGRSDIIGLLPIQDAVDKIVADAVVASEYTALRQRWATGVEVPKDAAGQPVREVQVEATFKRLWISENPDAKWGEFSPADLGGYVSLISLLTQHLAALSRTPPHYLLGQIVNASGDALKTAEATLVAKVRAKMVDFAEGWEDAIRCAFQLAGDSSRGQAIDAETIWADPESRTESEHADAMVKQQALGVPDRILWEQLGYSPQTIERILEIQDEEAAKAPTVPSPLVAVVPDTQQPPATQEVSSA